MYKADMSHYMTIKGAIAYLIFPRERESWGGPFNGQEERKSIFEDLLNSLKFSHAIETGTYRGTTTRYLAECNLKVVSVEIDDYFYSYSKCRFLKYPRVTLYKGDSKVILRKILEADRQFDQGCFFYLDAHWREHLPLKDEVDVIFKHVRDPVVMVDDFAVPDDPGYGFDSYGPGRILSLDYLNELIEELGLSVFFPVCRSDRETGAKRGCVVLARNVTAERIQHLPTLRQYTG